MCSLRSIYFWSAVYQTKCQLHQTSKYPGYSNYHNRPSDLNPLELEWQMPYTYGLSRLTRKPRKGWAWTLLWSLRLACRKFHQYSITVERIRFISGINDKCSSLITFFAYGNICSSECPKGGTARKCWIYSQICLQIHFIPWLNWLLHVYTGLNCRLPVTVEASRAEFNQHFKNIKEVPKFLNCTISPYFFTK